MDIQCASCEKPLMKESRFVWSLCEATWVPFAEIAFKGTCPAWAVFGYKASVRASSTAMQVGWDVFAQCHVGVAALKVRLPLSTIPVCRVRYRIRQRREVRGRVVGT